ncbi:hypothetical protein JT359_04570 [Candidatus Poribacteria bacterium]|nr:hypothetical protein [Candidatus Poribacteria bacterium]
MGKCIISEAHAIDYVYGELDPSKMDEYKEHLMTCNNCTRMVNSFKRVLQLVDDAEGVYAHNISMPKNLQSKLYRRINAEDPVETTIASKFTSTISNLLTLMNQQKATVFSLFIVVVIGTTFFLTDPFQYIPTYKENVDDTAHVKIQEYRQLEIQRNMEDVLRNRHLRNSNKWDRVSQLNRVKDQARGTDWATIAHQHLKSVHSEL